MQGVRVYLRNGSSFVVRAERIDVQISALGQLTKIEYTNPTGQYPEFLRGDAVEAVVRLPWEA